MENNKDNINKAIERFLKFIHYRSMINMQIQMHIHQEKIFICTQNPITTIYRNKYHEVIIDNRSNPDGTFGLSQYLYEGNQIKMHDATPAEVYMRINDLFFS